MIKGNGISSFAFEENDKMRKKNTRCECNGSNEKEQMKIDVKKKN